MDPNYAEKNSEFYAAVGRALSAWQPIEISLALLFVGLVGARSFKAAFASFGTLANWNARTQMLEAADLMPFGLAHTVLPILMFGLTAPAHLRHSASAQPSGIRNASAPPRRAHPPARAVAEAPVITRSSRERNPRRLPPDVVFGSGVA